MTVEEFVEAITRKGSHHKHLYHFTEKQNLLSIREHGLLSLRELDRRGVKVTAPGGNTWSHDADRARGLDQYVHLCLLGEHPMEYSARQDGRLNDTVFLRIRPEAILVGGVMGSLDVSNKKGVEVRPLETALGEMDLAVVYADSDWKDKAVQTRRRAAKKYEILVPTEVPIRFIEGL